MNTGASLGPYRIDRELGSGGMGKVFAATDENGGTVALKVIHPHLLETPGFFKRFMREAQLGQSIRHQNVVRTLDCDQEFGGGTATCFLVMEYVEGQTLSELLRELERVPEELCRHVAREICKGLAAVHDAGVVHRDLKPENVLITPEHVVKVMDLGVAQVADETLRLSKDGAFVGSVEYAAPEQFKGGDVDGRTDLHALGVLLYELASGSHPYRGGNFHEVLGRVCDEEPRRLGEINSQLSAFFEEVVHTLLIKDPRGRFASATQLLGVLEEGEDSLWWHERARSLEAETRRPIRRIRIPRETAVYGRDAELAVLREAYEAASAGGGQVVLIEGEAGIGKSRLVDEFVARLHADGEDVSFLFGSYPPGGAATASGAFSSAYREHFGEAGSADYLSRSPSLSPAFDALLRGEGAPPGTVPLTKDSLQTCFVNVTRALAEERPTIVLVDDLHFSPDEGRALFTSLALGVPEARVLLVGTTRPGTSQEWTTGLTRLPHTRQLALHRLGPKDLAALLKDCFRSEHLALGLAGQIGAKSDGNPFFAFEIIRGLREGQFITQNEDGTWASTRVIEDIEIPSSVLDLVNARVADLSEEERDILDVACCLGFEFDPLLVGEVLGMARIPLLKRLGQIERRHRLVRSSGLRYVFDHHQVQEALYGSLSELLRREYHAALAEALEARADAAKEDPAELDGSLCVDLCDHFLRGARGESALRYLAAAQDHLTSSYLPAQTAALTERALAVPGLLTGVARGDTLLRLVDALAGRGRNSRQEECGREAAQIAEAADDDALRIRAANALGLFFLAMSRHDEAEASHRRALDLAVASGDRKSEAAAWGNLGSVLGGRGRFTEAREHIERSLTLCRELGNRRHEASVTGNLGITERFLGRLSEAQALFERQLALCRELGDRRLEASAIGNLGSLFYAQGRQAEAQEHLERQLAIGREIGSRWVEMTATSNLANVLDARGRLAEAGEVLARSLALSRELGNRKGEAICLVNLGPRLAALGDRDGARRALDASIAICREIGAPHPEGYGLLSLSLLADEEDDPVEALRLAEESLALRRRIGHGEGVADSLLTIGWQHARAGDSENARAALEEGVRLSREQGRKRNAANGLALLAALPGGDVAAALAAASEVDADADTFELRWWLYRATGDASHLERAKHLVDARLAQVPEEARDRVRDGFRVMRDVLAAWHELHPEARAGEQADAAPDDDAAGGDAPTESPTRVG
jgi:tetratricopeptide (TPR) repeat protein